MTHIVFALTLFATLFVPQHSFAFSKTLLSAVLVTGAGSAATMPENIPAKQFQVFGTVSASTGSCDVAIEASNDGTNWSTVGEIVVSLSTVAANDIATVYGSWPKVRGNVIAISGTTATCTLNVSW